MNAIHSGTKPKEIKKSVQPLQTTKMQPPQNARKVEEDNSRPADLLQLSPEVQEESDNPVGDFAADINNAREVLADNFDRISGGDDRIDGQDLSRALRSSFAEDREAALFVLRNQAVQNYFDVGSGQGNVDGLISQQDLDRVPGFSEVNPAEGERPDFRDIERAIVDNFGSLLDTANGRGGRDGHVGADDMIAFRRNNADLPLEIDLAFRNPGFDFGN